MSFKQLFKKRYFYINIVLAIAVVVIFVFLVLKWLNNYTRHGQNINVPDFIGLQIDSLIEYAETYNMKYVVMDSVFDDTKPKGSIVLQNPLPNSNVKIGRTIYVSVVSQSPEMSVVPNLINLSVRQGVDLLKNSNLQVKELIFTKGFDRNAIQKVLFEGIEIEAGTKVLKNSEITLEVSKGTRTQYELIPDLVGMTEEHAKNLIINNSFNIGRIDRDQESADAQYYVYHQFPLKNTAFPLGHKINIRLSTQKENIENLYEESLILYDSTYYISIDSIATDSIATDSLELEEL